MFCGLKVLWSSCVVSVISLWPLDLSGDDLKLKKIFALKSSCEVWCSWA